MVHKLRLLRRNLSLCIPKQYGKFSPDGKLAVLLLQLVGSSRDLAVSRVSLALVEMMLNIAAETASLSAYCPLR